MISFGFLTQKISLLLTIIMFIMVENGLIFLRERNLNGTHDR